MRLLYLFDTLTSNGWKWVNGAAEDYSEYKMTIPIEYDVTLHIHIAESSGQLKSGGQYGIAWIDADYEYEGPYSQGCLQEMLTGIELAEDNLLLIGIPFHDDYKFSGRNAANKARRNAKIRRQLGLDEMERKEGWRKDGMD